MICNKDEEFSFHIFKPGGEGLSVEIFFSRTHSSLQEGRSTCSKRSRACRLACLWRTSSRFGICPRFPSGASAWLFVIWPDWFRSWNSGITPSLMCRCYAVKIWWWKDFVQHSPRNSSLWGFCSPKNRSQNTMGICDLVRRHWYEVFFAPSQPLPVSKRFFRKY